MDATAATQVRRCSWATPDLSEAEQRLRADYGATLRVCESRPDTQPFRIDRREAPHFGWHHVRLPALLGFDVEHYDVVLVNTIRAGTVAMTGNTRGDAYRRGNVYLGNFPGASYRCRADHVAIHTVTVPMRLLSTTADVAPSALRFLSANPVTAAAARRWTATLGHVQKLLSDPHAPSPLTLADTAHMLAAQILETFPITTGTPGTTTPGRVMPVVLRRAIAYLEENAHAEIGLADVASAVGLPPAGVRYLFNHYLGVSPTGHLRRIRLDRAHRELLDSDRSPATVHRIAARWGFPRPEPFAALYRAHYGQRPDADR